MVGRTSILPKEGFFLFYKTKNKAVPQPFSWLLGQPLKTTLFSSTIVLLRLLKRLPLLCRFNYSGLEIQYFSTQCEAMSIENS
jgi:hypothetical protein